MMLRLLNKRESCYLCNYPVGKLFWGLKCCCLNYIRLKSYYQVLGLNSSASLKDIKSAYYRLSLEFHPDKNKGCSDSVTKFHEITEAYEVLSNPEKKRNYDLAGNFKTHYSSFRAQNGYYYKPYKPFTGKTKEYDYDEHFRQHYDYERQRQVEYEHFKRRWESDFHRRNRNSEEYFRNQHKYNENERDYSYEDISQRLHFKYRRGIFYFLTSVWGFIFLAIPLLNEIINPEKISRLSRVYYVVKNGKMDDNSEKDE